MESPRDDRGRKENVRRQNPTRIKRYHDNARAKMLLLENVMDGKVEHNGELMGTFFHEHHMPVLIEKGIPPDPP